MLNIAKNVFVHHWDVQIKIYILALYKQRTFYQIYNFQDLSSNNCFSLHNMLIMCSIKFTNTSTQQCVAISLNTTFTTFYYLKVWWVITNLPRISNESFQMEPAEGASDAVPLDVSLHDVRRQLGVAGANGRQHVAAHVLL